MKEIDDHTYMGEIKYRNLENQIGSCVYFILTYVCPVSGRIPHEPDA